MKTLPHPTFAEIVEESRKAAAESAWNRAKQASQLRHLAVRSRHSRAARVAGRIKANAIRLVTHLVPEQVRVTVDRDYHVGFLSIRLNGHGKLHLPPGTTLNTAI
jgi:hypothetical protein